MKLSAYEEPGYRYAAGEPWRVLLDGRPLERVIRVDTATGVAWVYEADGAGNLILDGDNARERRILGSLRAERKSDAIHADRPGS